jgi:hypothetical protein
LSELFLLASRLMQAMSPQSVRHLVNPGDHYVLGLDPLDLDESLPRVWRMLGDPAAEAS